MNTHAPQCSRRPGLGHQGGVGLIEVLIAVLILSIGLLGMAALQTRALQNNESAFQRSVAVMQSYSVGDALRADHNAARNGHFNIDTEDAPPSGTRFADRAVKAWRDNLQAMLGDGATGSIQCNATVCTIVTEWTDDRLSEGGGDEINSVTIEFRL
ncbi:type IV pilus modification protein PilV [Ectothiorhodospira variabilis]|uniref:type IV pilus modification protein PilV n=1 Tax=Ectothiorhodospira variabilis TaxID=505694 RepID=UPI001EFA9675|nr:type IV pilus modification protein PilV [Ectothiorhodospira variabilis]MCG5502869.1 type IV pilus modification protein PilV [Ectothiorhodospira variabilis]MCG5506343.1 type IV pilus modification protein PilV [Ectothiorhodospira variabilis]